MHKYHDKVNLWIFLKNCSNEIRSNEIRIRREPPVATFEWKQAIAILNPVTYSIVYEGSYPIAQFKQNE